MSHAPSFDAAEIADVRVVSLPPMRVASVYAYGPEPESAAWAKLVAWAGPRGLLANAAQHRIFGFNNPNPSAGTPNYGYEFWIEVGPEVEPEGEVRIEEFGGGLYAVLSLAQIAAPYEQIPAGWMALNRWQEESQYRMGSHQWLEEHIGPADAEQLSLDLYMPLVA